MCENCPTIYQNLVENIMMQKQKETNIHGSCIASLETDYYKVHYKLPTLPNLNK